MTHPIATLRRLNAQFISNFIHNDVAAHDRLLHPDFTYIGGSGQQVGRADYLKNWATGFDPNVILYWDTRDERISVHGPVALVSSVNRFVERINGTEHVGMAAYTDTYLLEQGEWRCIRAQITPVLEQHWPKDSTIVSVYLKGVLQV